MNENFITRFETEAPECDAPALREKKPPGDFGANLRRLRWQRDLSLRQVSEATGIKRAQLNRYELGTKKQFRREDVFRLCRFYGVSADYILGFEGGGEKWVNG